MRQPVGAAVGSWALAAAFLLATAFPLACLWPGNEPPPGLQGEQGAALPALRPTWRSAVAFPAALRRHLDRHFAGRRALIRWHGLLSVKGLGVSTSPLVLVGRDGWLFTNEGNAVSSHQGRHPFTRQGLERWRRVLQARHDWLAARGIRYVVLVAPESWWVYPEYLRTGLQVSGPRRLDQFVSHMRERSTVPVVDPRAALLAAKHHGRLYYQTDQHWNELGGCIAYGELARTLRPWFAEVRQPAPGGFHTMTTTRSGGALARILGIPRDLPEVVVSLTPRGRRPAVRYSQPFNRPAAVETVEVLRRNAVRSECPGGAIPRLVCFRDSFMEALIPYLSADCGQASYFWTWQVSMDRRLVVQERPSVVIQEFVELALDSDALPRETPLE